MSTIRLENITRTFAPTKSPLGKSEQAIEDIEITSAPPRTDGLVAALDQVSLTIPDGKTLVILGPSGCGKSTLLRVVCGLESGYSGHVYYDDRCMDDRPPKDRHIGMVFQNYALYPHFEGHGNLSFFFRVRKVADEEAEERIRITSEIMGIGFKQLLARKPGTLSGGQQQRVAIARAIVRNPDLFLFDEPLSNLDAKLRVQTRTEIKRLLRRFGITAIYVTHDQVEAMALGDLVAVMRSGQVEQLGTFQELMTEPANTFVAGFLGTPPMNLFEGASLAGDTVSLGGSSVSLSDERPNQLLSHPHLTIGARPEDAILGDSDSAHLSGLSIGGDVLVIEPDFARQNRLVYLQNGDLNFAAQVPLDIPLNIGNTIEVTFPEESLFYFDGHSGERIC